MIVQTSNCMFERQGRGKKLLVLVRHTPKVFAILRAMM
jgi:hypothetical protein